MRIQRLDERLRAVRKPVLFTIDSIQLGAADALIVCAGFEDRSLGVLRSIQPTPETPLAKVLIVEYLPQALGNRFTECLHECSRVGILPVRYVYDRENPDGAADYIWEVLSGTTGRIYIDISGMSRLLIVQLIAAVPHCSVGFDRITILYSEAREYYPSLQQFTDLAHERSSSAPLQFLSWGVSQITVVPELSSTALQERPTHLIAFPTLDPQQFTAVRKDVEPSALTVIEGRPLHDQDQWRLSAVRQVNRTDFIRGVIRLVTSTYDYRETLAELLKLYSGDGRLQRLVICPTGSKLQTVAVGMCRAFLNDITIVYPTPRAFQTDAYTWGVRQLHRLDLDVLSCVLKESDLPSPVSGKGQFECVSGQE